MPTEYRKNGTYWIKGAHPPDVVARTGKKQYRRSLGTKDPAGVKVAYARVMLGLQSEWEAVRKGPQGLTKRQVEALAGQAYREWMMRHGDDPPAGVPWEAVAAVLDHALGSSPLVSLKVDDLAARHQARGIPALSSQSAEAASMATLKALSQAAKQIGRHAAGDFTPDPQVSRFPDWPPDATAPLSFDKAHELWRKENAPTEGSARQFKARWNSLRAFLGHDDVARITMPDVQRWKDDLRDNRGLAPKTIREGYIAASKAILAVSVERGLLPFNAALGVKVKGKGKTKNRPTHFYPQEAATILKATLAAQPRSLSITHARSRRWVPWLLAYTGARVAEITQLRKQDVQEHDGVSVILISPAAGSTKNNKARLVPIHPHLLEQGFLGVVRKAKAGPLFCEATATAGPQSRAEDIAQWVRSIGVADPDVQPNHAWRHLFKSKARDMQPKMDPETRDYVQGQVPRTEGERYGAISVAAIHAEIIRFPRYIL